MQQSVWQQKWVVGNWKMNGRTESNRALLGDIAALPAAERVCIGIAPPLPYLAQARAATAQAGNRIHLAAQEVSRFADNGAYTGEVSAHMLADAGADLVLVGHSERSLYFAETHAERRQKLENVLAAGLQPLLCVGETLAQREAGQEQNTVAAQLDVLANLNSRHIAVAYEPVWAIGTGKVATTAQIAQMHEFIYRHILSLCGSDVNIRILYGGSVNEQNAADIFSVAHVDGALVGGASLKGGSFAAIIRAAEETA
ncbi:triose-phosphate isomerase [Conchiformibius kuhniae]|uniref:Triosephosphate isomerase n=1 Tax=Conchiformibius kuhniae TaxID=211502 RepID=A0ABD8B8B9_9NEIS|nr:triose-phosphate isomerase [Conchiformibius kuhniae]